MNSFNSYKKEDPGDNGLNNASILTFSKDVIDALIKELTQNSIDAKDDSKSKVIVKVNMLEVDRVSIEGIEGLETILLKMIEYWTHKGQKDFVKFFENSLVHLRRSKISIFSYLDFNTKGLEGDETRGSFKNLIFDEGVSDNKPDNALGGFGIGKNSFFALSALQTVFYSSYNSVEGNKFIGVTKLAEYLDGHRKNNRVYYGDWSSGDIRYITDNNQIPLEFRRSENGLSSFALGVDTTPEWKNLVIKAFIKNYWFLFENDKIEAEIDDVVLNKTNYFQHAAQVFEKGDSILAYIETYNNPEFNKSYDVHAIGNIRILLSEEPINSEIDYPDKIVFFRDGMMIKEYNLGVRNLPNSIAGIIFCDNQNGNKILSMMEPPAHDDFQSFYLPKKHATLTLEDGKKIIKQIEEYKTSAVREIKARYSLPTKQVDFIDEMLSGMSFSTGNGNSVGKNNESKDESFHIAKKNENLTLTINSKSTNAMVINDDGVENDQWRKTDNKIDKRPKKKVKKVKTIDSAKIYYSHEENGLNNYYLVIHTQNDLENSSIRFTQHGDSPAKAITTSLIEVKNQIKQFKFQNHGSYFEIFGLNLKAGVRNTFWLCFEEDYMSAFKILN